MHNNKSILGQIFINDGSGQVLYFLANGDGEKIFRNYPQHQQANDNTAVLFARKNN